jgi:hypothetical protein
MGLLSAGLLAAILPVTAAAHGIRRDLVQAEGIEISSLTHGQMAVISRYRGAILAMAGRHYPPDDTLRRLANYAEIQRFWCFWGLMPGSVTDEASPFNLCAHAYLAAGRDALLRLQKLRPADRNLQALVHRIEADMIGSGASLILCEYSAGGFNTAQLIRPDWSKLLQHMPSLAMLGLAGTGVSSLIALALNFGGLTYLRRSMGRHHGRGRSPG